VGSVTGMHHAARGHLGCWAALALIGVAAGCRRAAPGPSELSPSAADQPRAEAVQPAQAPEPGPEPVPVALRENEPDPVLARWTEVVTLAGGIPDAAVRERFADLRAQNPGWDPDEVLAAFMQEWAGRDPASASAWGQTVSDPPWRQGIIRQIGIALAQRSLPDALEWIQTLENPKDREEAKIAVGYEAADAEPLAALNLLLDLPADRVRDDLLLHIAAQWADRDPQTAAEWVDRIEDPVLRADGLAAVATAWAEHNPVAAVTLAVTAMTAGPAQDRAVVAVVQRWAQQSPADAAGWVAELPAAALQEVAAENLVMIWAESDRAAAEAWLRSLPSGPLRERGQAALAGGAR
jgi:hypothetical protein